MGVTCGDDMMGHRRGVTIDRRSSFLVAVGGAAGASVRWGVIEVASVEGRFPWATLVVNVVGCGVLGLVARRDRSVAMVLGVGVCGGLTTFSTLAIEIATLLNNGDAVLAVAYVAASLVLGVGAYAVASSYVLDHAGYVA
jgi:CrcB protein